MKKCLKASIGLVFLILSACQTMGYSPPMPGMSEAALIARMGKPTATYQDGKERLFEYASYWGQETYIARFAGDGKLKSWEQVLTSANFDKVKLGEARKEQVLLKFGQPAEKAFFPRLQQEVWSYRFKEEGVWNSLMNIHFDTDGIVRKKDVMRDPLFDKSDRR